MGQISLFVAIFAVIGTLMFQTSFRSSENMNTAEAAAIAGNMTIYRNAVSPFAQNNPTTTGTVNDTVFGLPTWFRKINGVEHYLKAGTAYVYFSIPRPGLAHQILKASDNAITVGIKRDGYLINPLSTTNYSQPIALPSAIPEESVVYAF
jgi:hypothetical protein